MPRRARPFLVAFATILLVLPAPAPAAAARAPEARTAVPLPFPGVGVRVVSRSQRTVLARGRVLARVVARRRTVRVAVVGRARRATGPLARRPGRPVTRTVRVTLRRGRARTVSLRLTRAGRRELARCGPVRLEVRARRGLRAARRLAGLRRDPRRCPAPPTIPAAERYEVGLAARSINPDPDGTWRGAPVFLGGYGIGGGTPFLAGRAATGLLGPGVQVRALFAGDGRRGVAVADVENQGWFVQTKDDLGLLEVRREVERRTRGALPAERVIVQSDHSHGGPDAIGVWGNTPASYRRFVLDRTVDAILEAYRARRPGRLVYGTADGTGLLSNQFDYDEANRGVDGELRVLQARDAAGTPFATLLNFSAHTTVLGSGNTLVTGDWVSAVNPLLEARFGGRAMTMVGTLGRTQPADRGCADRSLRDAAASRCALDAYAERVADVAARAVAAARPLGGDRPVVDGTSYLVQDAATNAVILGGNLAGGPLGVPINRSALPPWQAGNVVGTVTASARVGDVLLTAFPGEAYPQMAEAVRRALPEARGFLTAGLANDQLGYLIAPYRAYPEPIRRTAFDERGDEVSPIDNDNYAFNVSPTMGERVVCSGLRGAGALFGRGDALRRARGACGPFVDDALRPAGADTGG